MLEVINLNVSFFDRSKRNIFGKMPSIKVLESINLKVEEGSTVGIVGESGSGKSTLGKAILKLCDVDSGSIIYRDKDITDMKQTTFQAIRKELQMIFQDPQSSLNPRHRIIRILTEPLLNFQICSTRKAAEDEAILLLNRVGLKQQFANRYPHELSGGQRQRVGIARAISVRPSLVVADEIVSGLDVSVQAKILELLKELKDEMKLSMLFISHDLSVIRVICDYVIVMFQGSIVEEGDCKQIFDEPKHKYTKDLLDAIPLPIIETDWLLS